jgi:hypothetical protein
MNEIQNKKRMLIIITCCAVIIIGFLIVFYFSRDRYVRAQELDCEDYNYHNLTMADLERMPFITSIINAGGDDVRLSYNEYNILTDFKVNCGSLVRWNGICYEIQVRMS